MFYLLHRLRWTKAEHNEDEGPKAMVLQLVEGEEGFGSPNGFQLEPNTSQLAGNGRFEAGGLVPCCIELALLGLGTR